MRLTLASALFLISCNSILGNERYSLVGSDAGTGGDNAGSSAAGESGTGGISGHSNSGRAGSNGGTGAVAGSSSDSGGTGPTTGDAGGKTNSSSGAAGSAAGGTSAGGTSAGGTSAGGTAAGGTSAGGTSAGGAAAAHRRAAHQQAARLAGGTSAGGTSAGGTSAGGTSAGGRAAGGTSAGGMSAGGTSAGGTSAGGTGGARNLLAVVDAWDGALITYPCGTSGSGYDCTEPAGCTPGTGVYPKSWAIGGSVGEKYAVTFRVRGVVEVTSYVGGVRDAGTDLIKDNLDRFHRGGAMQDSSGPSYDYNVYSLRVSPAFPEAENIYF